MESGDIVFWIAFLVAVPAAVMVVSRKNPVYSALWLLVAFCAFAVIFLVASAPLLAAVQVLVYAGAILVLFLFVIMLLNLKGEELAPEFPPWVRVVVGLLCLAVTAGVIGVMWGMKLDLEPLRDPEFGGVRSLGKDLYTGPFVFHFELIALLLLAALIGAMVLAQKKEKGNG
ncbi:MAG: NADH-quinone oxidoreductase subunit J family protein [Planctomycetota bacterium]|jgi:NADH-quinone oxidoreductase subunit J